MAFDRKKQAFFEAYVKAIDKQGSKFDFYKTAKKVEDTLSASFGIKMAQYLREVWEELEDPRSRWDVSEESLVTFFDALPPELLKRNLTDDILQRKLPPVEQEKYKKMVANFKEAQELFITENNLRNPIVTMVTRGPSRFTVKAYLGDIRGKIGVESELKTEILYRDFYDAVEAEIGKHRTKKALGEVFDTVVDFQVQDWPNMSSLDDAQYEITFYFEPEDELVRDIEDAVAFVLKESVV